MQKNIGKHPLNSFSHWRKAPFFALILVLTLQACGGGESTVESSSLTPSQADLKKDWTDQGTAQQMATGKAPTL